MGKETFSLKGGDGNIHHYVCQPHPGKEGTGLMLSLMSMGGEPLGRIIESKAAQLVEMFMAGELSFEAEKLLDFDVMKLLDGIQWSKIGTDFRLVLADIDGPELCAKLLKYTHRDGMSLDGAGYDIAYTQNYGELLKALKKVVEVNGFLGFISSLRTDSEPEASLQEE